ncbi:Cullin-1 [Grifola frondosa]|uniref:Cullin-1 n=1 Tax=Grifola frondosa TaxID=5627 RepID=A0A1C7LQC6_GRIFR|nr:Cullin-1 [Grifola frondosa]
MLATTVAAPPTPPANADFDIMWNYMRSIMDDIVSDVNRGSDISYAKYMALYHASFNFCTSSHLLNRTIDGKSRRRGAINSDSTKPTLYQKITEYFAALLTEPTTQCDGLLDDALLRHYAVAWDKYKTCARIIDREFEYFNRHHVKFLRDEGNKVYPVYTIALVQWRLHFLLPIQGDDMKLTSAILHLIEKQRAGATIDEDLIKTVVVSFVSLGIDERDLKNTFYDVYQKHFEMPFLDMMEQSYRRGSEVSLAANDVMKYVEEATRRLDEEDVRVERYLQPPTCKLLIARCEEVFVREHEKLLQAYLQRLIAQDDKDNSDIDRIHALLGRILDASRRQFVGSVRLLAVLPWPELCAIQPSKLLRGAPYSISQFSLLQDPRIFYATRLETQIASTMVGPAELAANPNNCHNRVGSRSVTMDDFVETFQDMCKLLTARFSPQCKHLCITTNSVYYRTHFNEGSGSVMINSGRSCGRRPVAILHPTVLYKAHRQQKI